MADRGSFHLGKVIDLATGKPGADDLVVGSSDLTTHGVIVGMTGSGKTGLAIVLLEEALLAGIPTLILDPKGDMGNLALTFPDLDAASFRPWVNESDAAAENMSVDDFASKTATTWREGLAAQGIGPERITQLKNAADVTIYTPGSASGVPLNLIGSLGAPPLSWDTEAETLRDEIEGTVTSLLALIGITADPLSSREHVLLANLIENAWRAGRDLDLGTLIGEIQSPRSASSACSRSMRSSRRRTVPRSRSSSTRSSRRRRSQPGARARHSISSRCSSPPPERPAPRSSISRTSPTRSACSSRRWCSASSSPGCEASPVRPTCAPSPTWTR